MAFHRHHRDDGTFPGPIISGAPFRDATFGEATFDEVAIGGAGDADVDNAHVDKADVDKADVDGADVDDEHRNDEHVVTLTSVPTSFGAGVVVAELESCGIKAGVVGRRVVVFEHDLATARAIIAEADGNQAADDEQLETDDDQGADDELDLGQQ